MQAKKKAYDLMRSPSEYCEPNRTILVFWCMFVVRGAEPKENHHNTYHYSTRHNCQSGIIPQAQNEKKHTNRKCQVNCEGEKTNLDPIEATLSSLAVCACLPRVLPAEFLWRFRSKFAQPFNKQDSKCQYGHHFPIVLFTDS